MFGTQTAVQPSLPRSSSTQSAASGAPVDLTDDALTGGFRVFQRRRGHRYSLDDCVTAWQAAVCRSAPARVLDLGCGIGSVLLMLAYKFPRAQLAGVEAQDESLALARRNVARNRVDRRVALHHGDLRDVDLAACLEGPYDLITGTPPYQPLGQGTVSPDRQRAHARVELRGGIEAYVQRAAGLLADGGRFVVCGDARRPERLYGAAREAGLAVLAELRVWPAARYKAPLFCVWTLGRVTQDQGVVVQVSEFLARDATGARTAEARALRAFFDLSIDAGEPLSPRQRVRRQPVAGGTRP